LKKETPKRGFWGKQSLVGKGGASQSYRTSWEVGMGNQVGQNRKQGGSGRGGGGGCGKEGKVLFKKKRCRPKLRRTRARCGGGKKSGGRAERNSPRPHGRGPDGYFREGKRFRGGGKVSWVSA